MHVRGDHGAAGEKGIGTPVAVESVAGEGGGVVITNFNEVVGVLGIDDVQAVPVVGGDQEVVLDVGVVGNGVAVAEAGADAIEVFNIGGIGDVPGVDPTFGLFIGGEADGVVVAQPGVVGEVVDVGPVTENGRIGFVADIEDGQADAKLGDMWPLFALCNKGRPTGLRAY